MNSTRFTLRFSAVALLCLLIGSDAAFSQSTTVSADFGSRTNTAHPISRDMFGIGLVKITDGQR